MLIHSSHSLHYPITIKDLHFKRDDYVQKLAPIFSYEYKTTVTEGNKYGEEKQVEKTLLSRFESETEGTLSSWKITAGAVIERPGIPLVEIEEPCKHDVQFGGLCANCGRDMTEIDYGTSTPDHLRASINMSHGNTALRVSRDEAQRVETGAKKRLLASQKLSLVVDLDQTIIHATVDPTVGDWMEDTINPNHESVKDVRKFQLTEEGPGRGCWYYVKMRPGLAEFLEEISAKYELHIYTMGTRAYADQIAKIVDPERKIFGDRILSRDESGSLTAKSLQRLFPVDTKMVVIIDDRGDVWDWSKSLVKVVAYDFFKGIGDINSSFLPKRQDVMPPGSDDVPEDGREGSTDKTEDTLMEMIGGLTDPDGLKGNDTAPEASTVDKLVSMGGANDSAAMREKVTEQDEQLAAQIADRPLLQEQLKLEQAEEQAEAETQSQSQSQSQSKEQVDENGALIENLGETPDVMIESPKPKHNLLQDDDTELENVKAALLRIHSKFYQEWNTGIGRTMGGGRVSELKGEKSPKKRAGADYDMSLLPDVQHIMSDMKSRVLRGTVIVFSGVIPMGLMPLQHEYGRWAASFGAEVHDTVSKYTTHVVGSPTRTTGKMRAAARHKRIAIVTIDWLYEAWRTWQDPSEGPYIIDVEPGRPRREHMNGDALMEDGLTDEDEESSDGYETPFIQVEGGRPGLRLQISGASANGPDDSVGSPIDDDIDEIDWGKLGDEFDDDDDDSDIDDSESETASQNNGVGKKRKRGSNTDTESIADGNESDRSVTRRKARKKAFARTSSLNQVTSSTDLVDMGEDGVEDNEKEKQTGSTARKETSQSGTGQSRKNKGDVGNREEGESNNAREDNEENKDDDDDDDDNDSSDADFAAELERQLSEV